MGAPWGSRAASDFLPSTIFRLHGSAARCDFEVAGAESFGLVDTHTLWGRRFDFSLSRAPWGSGAASDFLPSNTSRLHCGAKATNRTYVPPFRCAFRCAPACWGSRAASDFLPSTIFRLHGSAARCDFEVAGAESFGLVDTHTLWGRRFDFSLSRAPWGSGAASDFLPSNTSRLHCGAKATNRTYVPPFRCAPAWRPGVIPRFVGWGRLVEWGRPGVTAIALGLGVPYTVGREVFQTMRARSCVLPALFFLLLAGCGPRGGAPRRR